MINSHFKLIAALTLVMFTLSGFASDKLLFERVDRILKKTPLIDGHNDIPWAYKNRVDGHLHELDFDSDLTQLERPTHTDLPRLRAGRVGGQFWSVYIPIKAFPGAAGDASIVLGQIDFVYRMVAAFPDDLEIALTAADVRRIHREGKIASLMGMEGGHAIENSLATLRMFHKAGARYMTLTHSKGLKWADSATDEARIDGLSKFGIEVVREMNRIGMLVDLSHVSPATMHDALDVTQAPVIFSHSSAYAITAHDRNIPDDVLLKLKANNGVAMVTFFPTYVSDEVRIAWKDKLEEIKQTTDDPGEAGKLFGEWRETEGPKPTLSQVADHIDHIKNLIGIEHLGLGGDYDGMPPGPGGLEDVSTYPALFVELLKRGYSDDDVAAIAGENVLRVMAQAEKVAQQLQKERPASDVLLEELDPPLEDPVSESTD